MKLTDVSIKSIKPPSKGAVIHHDDTVAGFGVRVSEGGTKSFVLTHGAQRKRETIGRVGIVSLHDARTAAKRLLAEYTLGKHQPRSKSWDAALDEYLAEVKAKNRASTYKSYHRHLKSHFKFGATQMGKIAPADFQEVLDKLQDRPSELHHAFVYLRAFLKWAFRKHYIETNPIDRMKAPAGSKRRKRTLTDAELVNVWNAAPDDPFGRIVRLLILCGQRPGETTQLDPKKMVKGTTLTIPEWLAKNHLEHIIPIPTLALPYLHDLKYGGFSKAKGRLDKASGVSGWTLHDLRRTLRSNWSRLGIPKDLSERYINHISGRSDNEQTYDQYDYMPEMIAAVAKYEAWLKKLLKL